MKKGLLICLLFFPALAFAKLQVGVTDTIASENKALVKVRMKNAFAQPVKSARIWLLLLDGEGKIVGQKAQWLERPVPEQKEAGKGHIYLQQDEAQDFSVTVDTTRAVQDVKLTFSRIILEDGTMPDPRKNLEALDEDKS